MFSVCCRSSFSQTSVKSAPWFSEDTWDSPSQRGPVVGKICRLSAAALLIVRFVRDDTVWLQAESTQKCRVSR